MSSINFICPCSKHRFVRRYGGDIHRPISCTTVVTCAAVPTSQLLPRILLKLEESTSPWVEHLNTWLRMAVRVFGKGTRTWSSPLPHRLRHLPSMAPQVALIDGHRDSAYFFYCGCKQSPLINNPIGWIVFPAWHHQG
jgi:hypothetical protein